MVQRNGAGAVARHRGRAPDPETGTAMNFVRLGGLLMLLVGPFQVVEGVLALLLPDTYAGARGQVLLVDLAVWGWVHIVLGVLIVVAGVGLLRREVSDGARVTGMVVIGLGMLVQLAWLPAAPIWSIIMIGFGLLVLHALIVTSGDVAVGAR
ncbi:hypothetical protein ACFPK1_07470 [Actinomycetospora rhizophila]|uniref:DUF7144 domain-containing protein n=1 Tax=Actinomycetospora rhizophila TaxID=1416876 RepID=A0ABV9ZC83_9PSEU